MTDEQIQAAMEVSMADVKGELAAELKETIDAESSERFNALEASISKIGEELRGHFERAPEAPGAEVVKDLEKRLDEAEAKQRDLEEKLRKSKASQTVVAPTAEELEWGGRFLHDSKELRNYLRSHFLPDYDDGAVTKALGSGLFSTGGKLPATVADRFIDFVIEQQMTLSKVVLVRMNAPEGHTDELRVASRKLRAAAEATAPALADAVTTKRRTLTTVETIWAEDITLTLLEDAIERAGTEGHIAKLIATGFGNDSNDLYWNGDESSSDFFVKINDGMLVLLQNSADSDITDVDFSASPVPTYNREVMQTMLQNMDVRFQGRTDLSFWCSVTFAQKYADELSLRETSLGDAVMVNGFPALRYFGIPLYPETHIGAAAQRIILTPTNNLFYGVQRVFRVDSEWNARARTIEYTLSARTDHEYATGEAVVNGTNVPTELN